MLSVLNDAPEQRRESVLTSSSEDEWWIHRQDFFIVESNQWSRNFRSDTTMGLIIKSFENFFFFDQQSKVYVLSEALRVDTTSRIWWSSCRCVMTVTRVGIAMKRYVKTIQFSYRSMAKSSTERWTFLRLESEKKIVWDSLCVSLSFINLKESATALRKWWWKSLQRMDTRCGYTPVYIEILFAGKTVTKTSIHFNVRSGIAELLLNRITYMNHLRQNRVVLIRCNRQESQD